MSKVAAYAKFMVLVAGVLGIIAFFLPMIAMPMKTATATPSAFEIVRGIDAEALDEVAAVRLVEGVQGLNERQAADKVEKGLGMVRGLVMVAFAPALWLLVLGGVGVWKRFGRGLAIVSMMVSFTSLWIWDTLDSAATRVGGPDGPAIGLDLLMVMGVAGMVGGVLATIRPERRGAPAST
jgi:hypothetical protein